MKTRAVVVLATLIAWRRPTPLAAPNKEHLAARGRPPDAAGAEPAADRAARQLTESLKAINARVRRAGRPEPARRLPTRSCWSTASRTVCVSCARRWTTRTSACRRSRRKSRRCGSPFRVPACRPPCLRATRHAAAQPGAPGAPAPSPSQPPLNPGISPQRMYDTAWADYAAGQWALAIQGFDSYIKTFPKSPMADDAQFNIGAVVLSATASIRRRSRRSRRSSANYPGTNAVPDAWYKIGLSYGQLGTAGQGARSVSDRDQAVSDSDAARLAKQQLDRVRPVARSQPFAWGSTEDCVARTAVSGPRRCRSSGQMGSVNKVILVGNLGRDAELQFTRRRSGGRDPQPGHDGGLERQGRPEAGKNRVAPHRPLGQDRGVAVRVSHQGQADLRRGPAADAPVGRQGRQEALHDRDPRRSGRAARRRRWRRRARRRMERAAGDSVALRGRPTTVVEAHRRRYSVLRLRHRRFGLTDHSRRIGRSPEPSPEPRPVLSTAPSCRT